jgi:hypothetical protein
MAANKDVNPYIVGRDGVIGYYEAWRGCLSADIEQMIFDGGEFNPTSLSSN